MSGHSKWSVIKRAKGVTDARRSQVFTKLGHAITVAARLGGPDPDMNFRLRLAIEKAKAASLPKDNIDRAIAKGAGTDGKQIEEVTYEGFGPGGVALVIQTITDNRNRTGAEVRNVFARAGGSLGESGSVAWNFDSRGLISVVSNGQDSDEVALYAIDAGAEDVQVGDDTIEVYTAPGDLEKVKKALEDHKLKVESAESARVPKTTVQLDEKSAIQMLRLVEKLEALDAVQRVYFNAEFSDDVLASYTS